MFQRNMPADRNLPKSQALTIRQISFQPMFQRNMPADRINPR
jgi:hypothetical protein